MNHCKTMDVLKMLEIIYEAYDLSPLKNRLHQGVNRTESFHGILIESYYGTFCSTIITPFGKIKVSGNDDDKAIVDYIKSRITYRIVLEKISNNRVGCIGPFYLVTHIDGVPIEHQPVDMMTPETFYDYIVCNKDGTEQYSEFIIDCMNKKLIRDTEGIIDKLLFQPDSYPDLVHYLAEDLDPLMYQTLVTYKTLHIFSLLLLKEMIVF